MQELSDNDQVDINLEIESAIDQLLSNESSLYKTEINLINKFYKDYYSKTVNCNKSIKNLFKYLLIQIINSLNNKLNQGTNRLLFQIDTQKHQQLSCNQIYNLYELNIKNYLEKLSSIYSNRILIKLNQPLNAEETCYEIEQYRIQNNNKFIYLNKTSLSGLTIFNDLTSECDSENDYRFRIVVYQRKNQQKLAVKYAYFTLNRNDSVKYLNLNLTENPDVNTAIADLTTTSSSVDTINLIIFNLSYLNNLLSNFKLNQISLVLNLIMKSSDDKHLDTIISYNDSINEATATSSNDLIINLTNIKINDDDDSECLYYIDFKFDKYLCKSSCLVDNKAEIMHIRNINFDYLLQNAQQQPYTLSVYKIGVDKEDVLSTQTIYKLNLLEFLNTTNFVSVNNKILSLHLSFQLSSAIKFNTNLLNFELTSTNIEQLYEILENCLKQSKKDKQFVQNLENLHLKKLFLLICDLNKINNQPKKNLINEQLFKLFVLILSTNSNQEDLCDLLSNLTENTTELRNYLCKYLIQNLKNSFDNEILNEIEFITILRSFHLIILLLLKLINTSNNNENLKLNLKYDLNYIFMKISKKNFKKKFFIYSFINFKFISFLVLNNFYLINDIYEIICFKMFNDLNIQQQQQQVQSNAISGSSGSITKVSTVEFDLNEFNSYLKLIEEIIVEKLLKSNEFSNLLTLNYEFRIKFVRFIVSNFLLANNLKFDTTKLNLIFYLINNLNYKFDRKEFKIILKSIISAFELNFKCGVSLVNTLMKIENVSLNNSPVSGGSNFNQATFDFKLFLCLIDLITQSISSTTTTAIQQLNSYYDNLKLSDFIYMFHLFSYFLNSKINFSLKYVWLNVKNILTQFSNLIFKYLLRLIAILTIESTTTTARSEESNSEHDIELLFISYFKLEFSLDNQNNLINNLNQISNYLSKYKHFNEFLLRIIIKQFINFELNENDFLKFIDYLISNNQTNRYLVQILLIYELLFEIKNDIDVKFRENNQFFDLIQLTIDYKKSINKTIIEQKILTFKIYQLLSEIKLNELKNYTDYVYKIKFEIEYKLIKNLIKLSQENYYEIIVLYKNKLNLLNNSLNLSNNEIKIDEIEKFYYLNLFKYLCLYELSVLTKQCNQQQDINLIKVHNKSIYNQLFQIYKQIYKYFIKNSNNFKLVEYINLKLNELNLKLNNDNLKLVDEKLLFKNTHYYFCIGFFSNNNLLLSKSVINHYYLFTSKTNELLTFIQNYVLSNFESVNNSNSIQLLNLNQDPLELLNAPSSLNAVNLYVQIFPLKKLDKENLIQMLDDTLIGDELNECKFKIENENKYFYYDKPFFKNFDNTIENLWIERTIMFINNSIDYIDYFSEFIQIKCLIKLFLQPIQNAINDCNEKTSELREFINNFTLNAINYVKLSNSEIMSRLQPLTMRLLGCLDARVNGGIRLYIKSFLNETFLNEPTTSEEIKKRKYFCYQLYLSIRSQLSVLESGLTIHNRIIKHLSNIGDDDDDDDGDEDNKKLDSDLNQEQSISKNSTESNHTSESNLNHMKQLNKHLISCLSLLKTELDKFL